MVMSVPSLESVTRLPGWMLRTADGIATTALQATVTAVVSRVDLTALVRDNVDLDEVAATLDVDAIADRLDLLGIAAFVIDGIDLPAIIRESTKGVTSDAVRGARMRGHDADEVVARVVDRLLLRRQGRQTVGPNGSAPASHPDDETSPN